MNVIAKLRYLNIAPRKVRLAADLIRGKSVAQAETLLKFTTKRANRPLLKLIRSAMANAKNNFHLDESNLYISKIMVDGGPTAKRYMPRARGQAYEIKKRTSHVTLWLEEIKKSPKKARKIKKVGTTVKAEEKIEEKAEEKIEEKTPKKEKPEFQPLLERQRPGIARGIRKIFRRKSF
jgi:large subunit ribosomal protein L22